MFRKSLDYAEAGANECLRGIDREDMNVVKYLCTRNGETL